MKKAFAPAAVMLAAALLLGGCAASTAGLEHKTEAETVNVTTGMFAQAIDKNVTYVQNGSDWTEESSEITDWKLAEGYDSHSLRNRQRATSTLARIWVTCRQRSSRAATSPRD